jgi:hypothetical protein
MAYAPGDSLREVRERARVHRPICIVQRGECGCSLELVPLSSRYFIRRAGVDREVGQAEYVATQQEYRRYRDAGGTSAEATENAARWAVRGLTDAQMEQEYVAIYGQLAADRALFNAIRSRFRTARG